MALLDRMDQQDILVVVGEEIGIRVVHQNHQQLLLVVEEVLEVNHLILLHILLLIILVVVWVDKKVEQVA